jgi:hypothetical protein
MIGKVVKAVLIPHYGNGEWCKKQQARCPDCLNCVARDTLPRRCPGNLETGTKCDNYLIDPAGIVAAL